MFNSNNKMYKGTCLIFIIVTAVAVAHTQEDENNENSITTECYEESYAAVAEMDSNGVQEKEFIAVATQHSGNITNNTDIAFPTGFGEVEHKTEGTLTTTPSTEELGIEKARTEFATWADKTNCSQSVMGELKCTMAQSLIRRFNKHSDEIDMKKISSRLKVFVPRLESSNFVLDPELKALFRKYKMLLEK